MTLSVMFGCVTSIELSLCGYICLFVDKFFNFLRKNKNSQKIKRQNKKGFFYYKSKLDRFQLFMP